MKTKVEQKTLNPVEQLVGEIEYLNDEYRIGTPQASDEYYDNLLEKLAAMSPDHPLLKKGIIDKPIEGKRKRKLAVPMMSLDKLKTLDEVFKWLDKALGNEKNVPLIVTAKYNGISILSSYLKQATTRGDGTIGKECDQHFLKMNNHALATKLGTGTLCAGEAIISRENWKQHFEGQLSPYGKPYRLNNATVAGLLNADEPSDKLKYVDFVGYSLFDPIEVNKSEQIRAIRTHSNVPLIYICTTREDLDIAMLNGFFNAANAQYPIDGLVIDISTTSIRQRLGRESNGNPAYAKALKLSQWTEEFNTTITGHKFTMSKQGHLKGVVTFEPVFINGTEVKQATFYNAKTLIELGLVAGMPITVKKSGEIIPKIVAVAGHRIPDKKEAKKSYSTAYEQLCDHVQNYYQEFIRQGLDITLYHCPSCNRPLQWDENDVELLCTNDQCFDICIGKIEHFLLAIGVEEIGRPTIELLYNNGYKTIESIVKLKVEQLVRIDGFGERSADILISQLTKVCDEGLPLARILYAWDLFDGQIGEKTAQLIIDNVPRMNNLLVDDLIKIDGIGETTAKCFLFGLELYSLCPQLIPVSYYSSPTKLVVGSKYNDYFVCFSGIRDADLEKEIEEHGGKIVSGVSKTTTHLIVADVNQKTGKTDKARDLGVKIMTIEEFKQL